MLSIIRKRALEKQLVCQHHLHKHRQLKSNHHQYQHHKNHHIHHHHQKHHHHRHRNLKPKNHQLQKQQVVTLRPSKLSSLVGARTDNLPLLHLHPVTLTLGIQPQGKTSGTPTTNSSSQGPRCGVITGGDFSLNV